MKKDVVVVHHSDRRTDVMMPYAPALLVRRVVRVGPALGEHGVPHRGVVAVVQAPGRHDQPHRGLVGAPAHPEPAAGDPVGVFADVPIRLSEQDDIVVRGAVVTVLAAQLGVS